MWVQTLKRTTVGEREFEMTVGREVSRVRYGVRATDPDPTEQYDGICKMSLEFHTFEEAAKVFDAIVEQAVYFHSASIIAEFEAEAELWSDRLERTKVEQAAEVGAS